jgi:CheY-like chemotaxis protein
MKNAPLSSHILLIDDDPIINMINDKIITRTLPSARISAYTRARLALDRLKDWAESDPTQLPDLIFLDINMPEIDGWEFLDEFVALPQTVQQKTLVVMLTSSIDISDIARSRTYKPVRDFLSKPLSSDNLHTLISDKQH